MTRIWIVICNQVTENIFKFYLRIIACTGYSDVGDVMMMTTNEGILVFNKPVSAFLHEIATQTSL